MLSKEHSRNYIYIPQGHNCSHVAGCVGTMALPCITALVTGRLQWLEELVCTQDWLTPAGTTCDLRLPLSLSYRLLVAIWLPDVLVSGRCGPGVNRR